MLLEARNNPEIGAEQAIIISLENERRHLINDVVREALYADGELGETVVIGGREWAVGDRVIIRRNDREIDVDNGMRGTINAVSEDGIQVQIDDYEPSPYPPGMSPSTPSTPTRSPATAPKAPPSDGQQ